MRCKCGHDFAAAMREDLKAAADADGFESYVVVNDKDLQTFVRAEIALKR